MALQRLAFFCLCFLLAVVGLRAQAECDMIQASDIGSTTPSQEGFIALLLGGADAASRPMVSVSNVEVISLAVDSERNMFGWASVFATYDCSGMLCPSGTYPRTEQFEVECVESTPGNPIWTNSNLLVEDRNTPMNPSLTSADLRRDCSFCVSPDDRGNVGVPAAIAIDPEFHCAGIKTVVVSSYRFIVLWAKSKTEKNIPRQQCSIELSWKGYGQSWVLRTMGVWIAGM